MAIPTAWRRSSVTLIAGSHRNHKTMTRVPTFTASRGRSRSSLPHADAARRHGVADRPRLGGFRGCGRAWEPRIHGACAEGFFGPPGIISGRFGLALAHFHGRVPIRPLRLRVTVWTPAHSKPGRPTPDAVAHRLAAGLHQGNRWRVLVSDDDRARLLRTVIGDFGWQELGSTARATAAGRPTVAGVVSAAGWGPRSAGSPRACARLRDGGRRVDRRAARRQLHNPGIGEVRRQHHGGGVSKRTDWAAAGTADDREGARQQGGKEAELHGVKTSVRAPGGSGSRRRQDRSRRRQEPGPACPVNTWPPSRQQMVIIAAQPFCSNSHRSAGW